MDRKLLVRAPVRTKFVLVSTCVRCCGRGDEEEGPFSVQRRLKLHGAGATLASAPGTDLEGLPLCEGGVQSVVDVIDEVFRVFKA